MEGLLKHPIYEEVIDSFGANTKFFGPQINGGDKIVALYGGTFDPPHNEHLQCALKLYNCASIDKIIITVSSGKSKPNASPPQIRYELTKMMLTEILESNPSRPTELQNFITTPEKNDSKIDLRYEGEETAITITQLRTEFPEHKVIFVYGSDYNIRPGTNNITPLNGWASDKYPKDFFRGITQLQMPRPEGAISSSKIRQNINELITKLALTQENLNDKIKENVDYLDKFVTDNQMNLIILKNYIFYKIQGIQSGGYNKHKSNKHKSTEHKSIKHKSIKHKSIKHKSTKHKSVKHKSIKRKSL
jgi:nicotinic acid mononucleotide adenylyltransferase